MRFAGAEAAKANGEALRDYLARGHHGSMEWMARNADKRADPQTLWPDARSVIMLGVNYGPAENPLALLERRDRGAISVYARNEDYHDVVKTRLKTLAGMVSFSASAVQAETAICSAFNP